MVVHLPTDMAGSGQGPTFVKDTTGPGDAAQGADRTQTGSQPTLHAAGGPHLRQVSEQSTNSAAGGALAKKYQDMWKAGEIKRQMSGQSAQSHGSWVSDGEWHRQISMKSMAFRARARHKGSPEALPVVADQCSGYQASALHQVMMLQKKHRDEEEEDDHGHHDHGHGERPVSIFSAVISSIVNFLLMFGLNCAYGMIMFSESWMQKHQGLGVKMCLGSSLLVGFGYSLFSGVPIAIAGTDLNPVVLINTVIMIIAEEIGKEHNLVVPTARRRLNAACGGDFVDFASLGLGDNNRRLGKSDGVCGASSDEFCTGQHYLDNQLACDSFHEELRATSIFAVSFASLAMCIIFFSLGRLKLTRYVTYMPSAIMDAFLSCIGYKVFKYGLNFCLDDPRQFVPAAIVGVSLYFAKAYHVGPPAITIPAMLLIPLGVFYLVILVQYSGSDENFLDKARSECLFFPTMEDVDFWHIWTDSIGKFDKINFKAWQSGFLDTVIMLIVVLMDCLLKLAGTESKMGIKCDKDYECRMVGTLNFVTAACGSSVGYMQLKFNVINGGILGNAKDRRAGMGYAIWCGITFFTTIKLFNYMPRFFLGVLLFFAGASFVAENMWGSRKYLRLHEWLQIMLIVAVFIIFDKLLYAVLAGCVIVSIDFIRRYAKVPIRKGPPLRGGRAPSTERFRPTQRAVIDHMANSWLLVIKLKGFIFFASAESLSKTINGEIQKQEEHNTPEFRRIKFIVFDCENLDGMDPSAIKTISALSRSLGKHHVRLLWSSLEESLKHSLGLHGSLEENDKDQFIYLEDAVDYVQHRIVDQAIKVQENWCKVHPTFQLYHSLRCKMVSFEPFHGVLDADGARFGCPWRYCGRLRVKKYKTVLFSPESGNHDLYLIHSGAIGLFNSIPSYGEEWEPATTILRHGTFLNTEVLINSHIKYYAVALEDGDLVFWNQHHWAQVAVQQPSIANAVVKTILAQENADKHKLKAELVDANTRGEYSGDIQKALEEQNDREFTVVVTPEIQERVSSLLAAYKLAAFHFYKGTDLEEDTVLPDLPATIRHDLEIAFNTYCEVSIAIRGKNILRPEKLVDALMYAGIFNVIFIKLPEEDLMLEQFMALGHEAFMMRLSKPMVESFDYVFKQFDPDNSERLRFPELASLMRHLFHPHISVEFVANNLHLWSAATESCNKEQFFGFMSRFLRLHEMDWYLMQAFQETIGLDPPADDNGPPLLGLEVVNVLEDVPDGAKSVPDMMLDRLTSGRDGRGHRASAMSETSQRASNNSSRSRASSQKQHSRQQSKDGAKAFGLNPADSIQNLAFAEALHVNIDAGQYTFRTERLKDLQLGLSEEEIEEMFWVADCYGQYSNSGELDYRLVAPILMTVFDSPDRLPPIPRVPNRFVSDDLTLETKLQGMRTYVLDLRKVAHHAANYVGDADGEEKQVSGNSKQTETVCDIDATVEQRQVSNESKYNRSERSKQEEWDFVKAARQSMAIEKPAMLGLTGPMYYEDDDEYQNHRENMKKTKAKGDGIRAVLRALLEEPNSSPAARSLWIARAVVVVLAALALVLEPIITEADLLDRTDMEKGTWMGWEICITICFTVEFVLRVAVWTGDGISTYWDFIKTPLHLAEFLSCLPLYVELATHTHGEDMKLFRILRLCELARVLRLCSLHVVSTIFPPIAVCLTVVWGIYLKGRVSD